MEATAYFVVAEALTNVAKHSGASEARVSVWRVPNDGLVVEVVGDGKGGTNPETGTGLARLADRLTALDGQLFVESPAAGPTRVRAVLPLGLAQKGSGSRGSSARKEGFEVPGVRCSSLEGV